jgi:hypothetical protein
MIPLQSQNLSNFFKEIICNPYVCNGKNSVVTMMRLTGLETRIRANVIFMTGFFKNRL